MLRRQVNFMAWLPIAPGLAAAVGERSGIAASSSFVAARPGPCPLIQAQGGGKNAHEVMTHASGCEIRGNASAYWMDRKRDATAQSPTCESVIVRVGAGQLTW